MARFIEIYIHKPLQELLQEAPTELPDLTLRMGNNRIIMEIGQERLTIQRSVREEVPTENDKLPEDIDEEGPIA
ncbi:MAG: hypothetical protein MI924_00600 [Chloroflexales bacterium]|nr:hypothetical protein [Chloroflexales bacterium]